MRPLSRPPRLHQTVGLQGRAQKERADAERPRAQRPQLLQVLQGVNPAACDDGQARVGAELLHRLAHERSDWLARHAASAQPRQRRRSLAEHQPPRHGVNRMHGVGNPLHRLRNRYMGLVVADLDNQRMPRRAQRVRNRLHMWFSLSRHNHIRVEVVPQLLLDAQVHLQEARFGHRVYCALLRGNQESCLAGVGACTEHLTNAAGGTVVV